MTTFNPDDPRLTAYALGELNAVDRAAVERQIGDSVETLLEIEAIREVAGQLRAALRDETVDDTVKLNRSVSESVLDSARPKSVAADHSLALRAGSMPTPTLASVSREASSRGKFSGKLAVAASCLAMFGTIGIIGLSGRSEKSLALKRDLSPFPLAWHDVDQDGDGTADALVLMTDGLSPTSEELSFQLQRLDRVLVERLAETQSNTELFAKDSGGKAASSSSPGFGGLGGFDVAALGKGPVVPRFGGVAVTQGQGTSNRNFGSNPVEYRAVPLYAAAKRSGAAPANGRPESEVRAKLKQSPANVAFNEKLPAASVAQAADSRNHFYLGAPVVLRGDRSGNGVLDEAEGIDRYEVVKVQRQLNETLAKLRDKQLDEIADLDGEVLESKQRSPNGGQVVELSVGSDDGVAVGDNLSVIRSEVGQRSKFLGRVRVLHVTPDRSVAQVVIRPKNAALILKGDRIVRIGVEEATPEPPSAEAYAAIHDNPFATPLQEPLSTFSIDVDTAAYSNMRRFLTQGSWPPVDSVRIEELVNYFSYDYAPPTAEAVNLKSEISNLKSQISNPDQPFAVHLEVAGCPWNAEHRLVRVGLKGKEIALDKRPVSNIVFLIDVSGSMNEPNKLPLVKAGLKRLVDQFTENDRVGIVVYAGASGLVLDSTNATHKDVILSSIDNLQAGGSTNGGEGIQLAYALTRKHFIEKGTNRVILCTDGDFNVGITNQDDLTRLIEEESKSGVFLSVLGFGMGNLKDSTLEKLADKGNGNYAYIDTLREANKVFVEQMTGTLITIAKDVKIQIEFNPAQVGAYRLIGYENRLLAAQDFHDDTKDAGEIGAGHTVTALYEIIPPGKLPAQPKDPAAEEALKYQPNVKSPAQAAGSGVRGQGSGQITSARPSALSAQRSASNELLTIKLRYKQPDADKSSLIEMPLTDDGRAFAQASTDFRFAASVASFGMILRHSPHRGNATLDAVAEIAQSSLGVDKSGYRSEFVSLVRSAKAVQK